MKITIINHYYSVSTIHRYNRDFDTPDYYRSIIIGNMECVTSRVFIDTSGRIKYFP